MPSRRSHTKSHHGCVQCKTRRVKCDETLPECQRCVRRQMQCSFREQTHISCIRDGSKRSSLISRHDAQTTAHGIAVNAPTPASMPEVIPPQPINSVSQQRSFGMLELELIHHYSTQTYITLTSRLTSHIIWRDVLFREAVRCDFLLDALMATSALHKSNLLPEGSENRTEYARRALAFQNSALTGYIPALNNPTEANSIALYAVSLLLLVWSFGSKRLPEGLGGSESGMTQSLATGKNSTYNKGLSTEEPLDLGGISSLLQMMQGINPVLRQTRPWLESDMADLLRFPTPDELPPIQPDVAAAFDFLRAIIAEDCGQQASRFKGKEERHTLYLERLQALEKVARSRNVLEWDLYIFSWPVTVEPLYLDLLKQRDPIALVLFIYWATCFRSMDHLWWARGWSYRLVRDVSAHLDQSWSQCLEWPRRLLGLDYQVM